MSYQKMALRLAFVFALAVAASHGVFAQPETQDPSTKPRNVKPELKKAYKDWLDKDVTYIITDEERKAFKKLAAAADTWPVPEGPRGNLEFFVERLVRRASPRLEVVQ